MGFKDRPEHDGGEFPPRLDWECSFKVCMQFKFIPNAAESGMLRLRVTAGQAQGRGKEKVEVETRSRSLQRREGPVGLVCGKSRQGTDGTGVEKTEPMLF